MPIAVVGSKPKTSWLRSICAEYDLIAADINFTAAVMMLTKL
jgi:hypothetical protein